MIKLSRIRWTSHVAIHERNEKYSQFFFFLNPIGKRPLKRSMHRWEDTIKVILKDVRWEGVNWIHLTQEKLQSRDILTTIMNLYLYEMIGILNSSTTAGFSRGLCSMDLINTCMCITTYMIHVQVGSNNVPDQHNALSSSLLQFCLRKK
jgi:hypothetical protein